jgi:hypothetical protein
VYHLFPNTVIATFPTRYVFIVLEPQAVGRTAFLTTVLGPREQRTGKGRNDEAAQRLLAMGGAEDLAAAQSVQRGLTAGANEALEFGLYESGIAHFHRNLDAALARP